MTPPRPPVTLPLYYDYAQSPLKVVATPEGGLRAYKLNSFTGRFDVHNSALIRIKLSRSGDEVFASDEDEFIESTEAHRSLDLRGDGPIFTVYQLRRSMTAAFKVLDEWTQQPLLTAIPYLYRWTFRMWEEEFARQDAGEPPSFHYEPTAPPELVERLNKPDPTPDLAPLQALHFLR